MDQVVEEGELGGVGGGTDIVESKGHVKRAKREIMDILFHSRRKELNRRTLILESSQRNKRSLCGMQRLGQVLTGLYSRHWRRWYCSCFQG